MQTRHRTPSIFNLSMVDVMCCALGAVIFLWLLNFRQAWERGQKAGQTHDQLVETRSRLEATLRQAEELNRLLEAARERLALTEKDRDGLRLRASATEKDRDRLSIDLALARKDIDALKLSIASTEDRLSKKSQEQLALAKDLASLKLLLRTAEAELVRRMQELSTTEKQLASLQMQLKEKDLLAKTTARAADDIAGQLRESDARIAALTKALSEQKTQTDKATQARLAAENRFAGIAMTGKRVVFLVDISGSMELIDGLTAAPDKWTGACETLARVIKSLPDLEKYQVIAFSNDVSYPLGGTARWLDYDSKASADNVLKSLQLIKPKGNTNLYAAFDAAFRMRSDGLDTIYILSDGLPNMGPGLPADGGKSLNDTERASLLAQHVRRTLRTSWNRPIGIRPPVRINAIGFFYESPDVGAFLWALARENDGSFVGMSKP